MYLCRNKRLTRKEPVKKILCWLQRIFPRQMSMHACIVFDHKTTLEDTIHQIMNSCPSAQYSQNDFPPYAFIVDNLPLILITS